LISFGSAALILAALSCRSKQTAIDNKQMAEIDRLTGFFSTCEKDIRNAVGVVMENEIIKNLTHLQKMNAGGRKYYLLERENLTSMIMAVTEGVYTDLILINRHGTVIYTMINDNIFGKNAAQGLHGSAIHDCFEKSREGSLHIEDVTIFPPVTGSLHIFISMMDVKDEFSRGVFIMQIDMSIIQNLLGDEAVALDREGLYRITPERDKIFSPCPYFNKIDVSGMKASEQKSFIYDEREYMYSPFNFADLFWIIVTPGRL
jgi:hypothetical protein